MFKEMLPFSAVLPKLEHVVFQGWKYPFQKNSNGDLEAIVFSSVKNTFALLMLYRMLIAMVDHGHNCSIFFFFLVQDTEIKSLRFCIAITVFAYSIS